VGLDVLRPDHAGDLQDAGLEVDAHFLAAVDDQVAVRQDLRHHRGDSQRDRILPRDLAGTGAVRRAAEIDQVAWVEGGVVVARDALPDLTLQAKQVGRVGRFGVVARPRRAVRQAGGIGDVDGDRQDIADLGGALILEEGASAGPPQRVRLTLHWHRLWHRHRHGALLRAWVLD